MRPYRGKYRKGALAIIAVLAAASARAEEKPTEEDSTSARRIVVSIPDRKLALLEGDRVVKIWDTAVGTESTPSPSGTFTVVNRVSRPSYYRPGKVVPPGPSNPVGTRWLGLSLKGFGIHGTNEPKSIGRKVSHGCIRMRNRDVEELFELVQVGVAVELHRKRSPYLARIFSASPAPSPVLTALAGNSHASGNLEAAE